MLSHTRERTRVVMGTRESVRCDVPVVGVRGLTIVVRFVVGASDTDVVVADPDTGAVVADTGFVVVAGTGVVAPDTGDVVTAAVLDDPDTEEEVEAGVGFPVVVGSTTDFVTSGCGLAHPKIAS